MGLYDVGNTMSKFREFADKAGLPRLHLVGRHPNPGWDPALHGFDAVNNAQMPQLRAWVSKRQPAKWISRHFDEFMGRPITHSYREAVDILRPINTQGRLSYPNAIPNWDNSPCSGKNGLVITDSTPELWREHLEHVVESISHREDEHRIFFIKSRNEWAEGNHLEPDLKFRT